MRYTVSEIDDILAEIDKFEEEELQREYDRKLPLLRGVLVKWFDKRTEEMAELIRKYELTSLYYLLGEDV